MQILPQKEYIMTSFGLFQEWWVSFELGKTNL